MSNAATCQEQEVERNFKVFAEMLDGLIEKHEGRWALLRAGALVEVFDTIRDAHAAAWKLYSDDRFSVQEITNKPVDLGFYSYAGYQRTP